MVTPVDKSQPYALLASLLTSSNIPADLPQDLNYELLLKGSIFVLQNDASPDAVQILQLAAQSCPSAEVQTLAMNSLADLQSTNEAANIALFDLAIYHDNDYAQNLLLSRDITSIDLSISVLFHFLVNKPTRFLELDPDFKIISKAAFDSKNQSIASRILQIARNNGFNHWATIVESIHSATPESYIPFLASYPRFSASDQEIAIHYLSQKAIDGSIPSRDTLCELFLQHEDLRARDLALSNLFSPQDLTRRALFLFLTEQWSDYESLDFSHALLNAAYESAPQSLRRRLLSQSRYTGQIAWLQERPTLARQRWIKNLTDLDWNQVVQQLSTANQYQDLWKLAQSAPPVWSSVILSLLAKTEFMPTAPDENEQYRKLIDLVSAASQMQPQIHVDKTIITTQDNLATLVISPGGRLLISAGSSQVLHRWSLPQGEEISDPIYGPAPQARALAFSPDGQFFTLANGDNHIRIFRADDGKLIKTLEGHSGLIRSLLVHPDGRTMFSAGFDGTLCAWRFPLGPRISIISQTSEEIFECCLTMDGKTLISAGSDRLISVWNWPEGKLIRTLSGHTATILSLSTAADSQWVASASRDQTIRIWNFSSGKQLQSIPTGDHKITALAFHPCEQYLFAATYSGSILVYNTSTGNITLQLRQHTQPVVSLAITPDGNSLISGSADGKITIFNLLPFLLARQPVETKGREQMTTIEHLMTDSNLPPDSRAWLTMRIELIRWKNRYDIEISEPQHIQLNDFDIELD